MGEAKAKEQELADATERLQQGVRVNPKQVMVVMLVDLVCHTALGAAAQIGRDLKEPGIADELDKSIRHLQAVKTRYLGAAPKVLLAPANALPRR